MSETTSRISIKFGTGVYIKR